ncbi:7678_t:CDS:2 [Funneliformis mosseae]|uniref:7678_t:CDS:1 n=1 Tax=Funneliformis mosseae TaxID=27381 RepID=A0A9N8WBJ1_FUNMO|nr:7678_t:CDS:2 [Funneliformis mosseae]
MPLAVMNQETSQVHNNGNPQTEENYIFEESNRTRIVALAVREACYVANYHKQHDWDSACQLIFHNKLLTFSEKAMIITLFQCKQCK